MRPLVVCRALRSAVRGAPRGPTAPPSHSARSTTLSSSGQSSLPRGFASTSIRRSNGDCTVVGDSKILQVAEKRVKAYKEAAEVCLTKSSDEH